MLYWNGHGRYGKRGKELWVRLVPKEGPASTVQRELVRSIGRLADEFYRNGNQNWGAMFREMLACLRSHLVIEDSNLNQRVSADLDRLEFLGEHPGLIEYERGEDEVDRLTEAVLHYCDEHRNLMPNEKSST